MTSGSKSSRVSTSDVVDSGRATQERIRCCWAGPSTKPADGTARRVSALGAARNLMVAGLNVPVGSLLLGWCQHSMSCRSSVEWVVIGVEKKVGQSNAEPPNH